MSAGLQCCRLSPLPAQAPTRVQQPDQGTARASGQEEAGRRPGGRESWAAAASPPVGLSALHPSEAEPAPPGAGGGGEVESSPGALGNQSPRQRRWRQGSAPAGGEHQAAGAGGKSGPRGDRGAARGVGRPDWAASQFLVLGSEMEEERRRKEGGRVSRRAGTGQGTGRRRLRWGWRARDAETGRRTARSPSTGGGQMAREAGVLRGWVWGRGPWDEELEAGGKVSRWLRGRPAAVRPRGLGLEGSGVPALAPAAVVPGGRRGRQMGGTGAPRPSFLLSSALSGD